MWGHDFRPDYLFIRRALEALGDPTVLGMTATATPAAAARDRRGARPRPRGRPDERRAAEPPLRRRGGRRQRGSAADPRRAARARSSDGSAIVYARSRDSCERVARTLRGHGLRLEHYHAGLEAGERSRVQDDFVAGRIRGVVATTAFGMGIDKPDVRLVCLFNYPDSLESYVQMVGRGGRDGAPSETLLLASPSDATAVRRFAVGRHPRRPTTSGASTARSATLGGTVDPDAAPGRRPRSARARRDARAGRDRAARLRRRPRDADRAPRRRRRSRRRRRRAARALRARGDGAGRADRALRRERPLPPRAGRGALRRDASTAPCGACDVCDPPRASAGARAAATPLPADVAGSIVRAVAAPHVAARPPLARRDAARLGLGAAVGPAPRPRSALLEAASDAEVKRWLKALEAAGALVEVETRRRLPRASRRSGRRRCPSLGPKSAGPVDDSVVERLRSWRRERSREDGVPAYVVLHDATLRDLAAGAPDEPARARRREGLRPDEDRALRRRRARRRRPCRSRSRLARTRDDAGPTTVGQRHRRCCLCVDSTQGSLRAALSAIRRLELTSCGFDDARRHRASGAGFVSCASSPCSPCWCCSRGRRSPSVWFAPSRARSRCSTPRRSTPQVDGVIYALRTAAPCSRCSAATRAASSSRTSTTSRRSCGRRSSRSRTAASTSTTASTRAASCARSGRTSARRASSRAARRSRSSSSRTRTSATSKTIARKVREAALAWQLEQRWSKDRILLAYLNTIYFGNGAYGIQQAARTYFGKGAQRAHARRVGAARRPARPTRRSTTRRSIRAPRSSGGATSCRRCSTRARSPRASCATRRARRCRGRRTSGCPGTQGPAQYFVNYVKDQLIATLRRRAGLRRRAQGDEHDRPRPPGDGAPGDRERPQDARAARPPRSSRSIPRTGAVRAMVGGSNFRESQFNLATQAERQPGSSFKPIVLATALRQGISPVTTFESKPVDIDAGDRDLARDELRGRLPRPGRPGARRWSRRTTPSTRS